jgi:hypothetical protein
VRRASMRVAGLFAGIGGLELGMASSGHRTQLLVENSAPAMHVLRRRFPDTKLEGDVRDLVALPARTDVVVAGFPCQDLSSVGRKVGIDGARSSLIGEVLRLLEGGDVPWLVLENVPFLMSLGQGAALTLITTALTELGYRWAYRVVDPTRSGCRSGATGGTSSPAGSVTRVTCYWPTTSRGRSPLRPTPTWRAVSTGPRACGHSAGPSTACPRSSAARRSASRRRPPSGCRRAPT